MIGTLVGAKYRIERLLGEGGMGAVYEATIVDTGDRVAVKVVVDGKLANHPSVVRRFQREARAMRGVTSPHIARILDAGTDEASSAPFLVMELLVGSDVKHLVRRGPLRPEAALRVAAQACAGLAAAHGAGIVHRDIKAANLFVAEEPSGALTVKILDFGIAKAKMDRLQTHDAKSLTRTGSLLGTPLYMSPEQAQGEKTVDHRTDVWSLGAVLYEALSGRTPHEDAETVGKLIVWIVSRPAPALQDFAPWVVPEIAAIVHRALAIDPDARFQSAAEMLDEIAALLPDGDSLSREMLVPLSDDERRHVAPRLELPRPSVVLGSANTVGVGATQPAVFRLPAEERRPARRAAATLFVLGALGAGGWLAFGRPGSTPAAPPEPQQAAATSTATHVDAPPPAATRTVRLVVVPPGSSVAIDGEAARVVDGAVEIAGKVGSRHEVHVVHGSHQKRADVVITDDGAFPDRLVLESPPPSTTARPVAVRSASAVRAPTAAPSSSSNAPKKPRSLTEADKFE